MWRGEGYTQHDKQHIECAVEFWGDMAVHRAVLLGGGWLCDGQCARGQRHSGECCDASGSVVEEEAAVQGTVKAVGRDGGATEQPGVMGHSV